MPQAANALSSPSILTSLATWAHTAAPAGSDRFEAVAIFSLVCYLVFAVVALHYALKPWAEKAMGTSLVLGALASLVLHLSLRHTPAYVGEGSLWKFVAMSQYLPWAVLGLGSLYVLYRLLRAARQRHR